jgi:hypothetical protein
MSIGAFKGPPGLQEHQEDATRRLSWCLLGRMENNDRLAKRGSTASPSLSRQTRTGGSFGHFDSEPGFEREPIKSGSAT